MGRAKEGLSKGYQFRQYLLEGKKMIFVTVGTHEQPFNRLVKTVDELKRDGVITEDVIMQRF